MILIVIYTVIIPYFRLHQSVGIKFVSLKHKMFFFGRLLQMIWITLQIKISLLKTEGKIIQKFKLLV